ncbi:MAG: WD40 repeat domain-containing protein [Cyanobacteria bacterium J06597_1]
MNRRLQWLLAVSGVLAVGLSVAIAIRIQTWPCGRWDEQSGCVAAVRLDTRELGFVPGTLNVGFESFDLSAGAETILIGLNGYRQNPTGANNHDYGGILALFNARTGQLIRVLREVDGLEQRAFGTAPMREVALSPDGQLAASFSTGATDNGLLVQRTFDGTIVDWVIESEAPPEWGFSCGASLDFSPNNQFLECGNSVYTISDGTKTGLTEPRLSDLSVWRLGRAPDGTVVDEEGIRRTDGETIPLRSPLQFSDSAYKTFMFAPNSQWFLEAESVYQVQGIWSIVPPPFRRLSTIQVWNIDAELQRTLFTNKRFSLLAWSRDSQYFAVLNEDLTVQIFRAPDSPEE